MGPEMICFVGVGGPFGGPEMFVFFKDWGGVPFGGREMVIVDGLGDTVPSPPVQVDDARAPLKPPAFMFLINCGGRIFVIGA